MRNCKGRIRVATLYGACAAVLLAVALTPSAYGMRNADRSDSITEVSPELQLDAETYATAFGVSVDQALSVLENSSSSSRLQEVLRENYPENFGGLHVENPSGRVIINWAGREPLSIPAWYTGEHSIVESTYTEAELGRIHQDVATTLEELGIRSDSWVDIRENRVVVEVKNADSERARAAVEDAAPRESPSRAAKDSASGGSGAVSVRAVQATSVPAASIYGGVKAGGCTAGLMVRHTSSGTNRATTAGHCTGVTSIGGHSSTFNQEFYTGSRDIEFHTVSGHTLVPRVIDNSSSRLITATKSRASLKTGDLACKYGQKTYYTCGVVAAVDHKPSYVPSANRTFIRVTPAPTFSKFNDGGDSGGPVYVGNTALGWVSGKANDNSYGIFMSLTYLPSGYTVLKG